MFEKIKDAKNERGYILIERNISARQQGSVATIRQTIGTGANIRSMTDSDGKQQFILGITPMNSNYRVGH